MSKSIFALTALAISCFAQGNLDSANWKDRAAAFRSITTVTPQDQQRIIALLDKENKVVNDALTASGGKRGVSTTLGEEYSEYYSTVLGKVAEFATNGNDAAVPTLAGGAYNEDSKLGSLLVTKWRITLPLYMQVSARAGVMQSHSLHMLGLILGAHRNEIAADQLNLAETRLTNALTSPNSSVRIAAIRSSVQAGSTKGLETIKKLATDDNAQSKSGKQIRFPVREEAAKAVPKLQR